jgi:hypothetical protein
MELISRGQHHTKAGLNRIIFIRNSMNLNRSVQEREAYYITSCINFTLNWVTGFIDGEGNFRFQVTPNKTSKLGERVALNFSISQSAAGPLHKALKEFFSCGSITKPSKPRKPSHKPSQEFRITGIQDCA